jgi:hypothetical protein
MYRKLIIPLRKRNIPGDVEIRIFIDLYFVNKDLLIRKGRTYSRREKFYSSLDRLRSRRRAGIPR